VHRQSYTKSSLRKVVRRYDFDKANYLTMITNINSTLVSSLNRVNSGFVDKLNYNKAILHKKPVYKLINYSDNLVIRKTADNIRYIYNVKQNNRDTIIYNLLKYITEGVKYRLYKLDIKSFYESIDIDSLISAVEQNIYVSRPTVRIISTLLNNFRSEGVVGLPRGLSLSAALSEVIMKDFDDKVRNNNEVFFYSRYVDDIIIITSSYECELDMLKELESMLPAKLLFNKIKTKVTTVANTDKKTYGHLVLNINYLGYSIKVSNGSSGSVRCANVDIADNKVNKLKTRLIRAFIDYNNTKDFSLLVDRLNCLAGNYTIYDKKTETRIKTGIYYNYKHVSEENAINELDKFKNKIILSNNGPVSSKLNAALNSSQRNRLLKITFKNGFNKRVFHYFSYVRLNNIKRCWLYV